MWKLLLLVQLCIINGNCQVIRAPINMAVVVGERLDMTCQPEIGFIVRTWVYQTPFNTTERKIYANWSSPRIHIDRFDYFTDIDDSINIYVNSTGDEDAGTYCCYIQLSSRQPECYSAQVIVVEMEPVCEEIMSNTAYNETMEEGSIVWMKCSLNFRGNLAPTMEWSRSGGSGEIDEVGRIITEVVETTVTPDENITSTLALRVDSSYNATFIMCKIYFQWDNTSSPNSTATNAPDYSYTWNSSVIFVSASPFVQGETTAVSQSIPAISSTKNGSQATFDVFNSIYLVAGVAIIFGLASSLVAICLCLRLRRKNSAAMAKLDTTETVESQYDLIPYAITDGYDQIAEVDEKEDIMFSNFPPREGPLPAPGYSALMPDEPKPPGVYSRMDHKDTSPENDKDGIDGDETRSRIDKKPKPDVDESHRNETVRVNSYLALNRENIDDDEEEGEEISSEYLKTKDDSLRGNSDNNVVEISGNGDPNGYLELVSQSVKEVADKDEEFPSAYLRLTDDTVQSNSDKNSKQTIHKEDTRRKAAPDPNAYLELLSNNDREIVTDNENFPSIYLTTIGGPSHEYVNNKTQEVIPEVEIPSSYLTTRDVDSTVK